MKSSSVWVIIILAINIAVVVKPQAAANFEQQLRQELFTNRKLNPLSRPGRYHNDTMNVKMTCAAQTLHKLDARKNVLKMTLRIELSWDNRDLAWNPRDYGGIEAIHVQPSLIWTPYITVLNSMTNMDENSLRTTRAVVHNTGSVSLKSPLTTESHCVVDIHRFPFDKHKCALIFGSWTHDGTHVNVTSVQAKMDTEDRASSEMFGNDFQLIQMSGKRSTYRHTCCREIYFVGLLEYELQRQHGKYQVGILLPAALICLLTAGIFWVTPLTGNRLKMGLVLLLANLLLLINLGLTLPISSSSTPSIIIFCVHTLCFTTLSLILSMVAINLSAKHPSVPSPACTQSLANGWLIKYLFIDTGEDETTEKGWLILVAVIDRISFAIFCISFLFMFILYLH